MLIYPQIAVIVVAALAMLSYLLRWRLHRNGIILSRALAWGVVVALFAGITWFELDPGNTRSLLALAAWFVMALVTTLDNLIVYKFEGR